MAKKAAKRGNKRPTPISDKEIKHLFGKVKLTSNSKDSNLFSNTGLIGNLQSFEDPHGMLARPKSEPYEEVVHPKHYNGLPNGVECWDVVEHFPTNVGSAIKYLWRAGQKPGADTVKDLKKALQWTQRQIDLLEGKNPNMQVR